VLPRVVPADPEAVHELALAIHRQIRREVGIMKFEGEPAV
jgi:hypothetical protein